MSVTRIYLVRHAEAEGNISRRFHGQYDSNITENGERQLKLLSKRFETIDIDAAYSSDLKRAYKTAVAAVGDKGIEVIKKKGLREIDGGDWENRDFREIADKYADVYRNFVEAQHLLRLPGGESALELQTRIKDTIFDIVKENPNKAVCVASHGMAIKTFLCYVKGVHLKDMRTIMWCDNTAINAMDFSESGDVTFVWENDSTHLTDDVATIVKQKWWQDEKASVK